MDLLEHIVSNAVGNQIGITAFALAQQTKNFIGPLVDIHDFHISTSRFLDGCIIFYFQTAGNKNFRK
jgi:hypothetical protein